MGQSVGVSVVCNSATVSDIRRHPSQSVNLARGQRRRVEVIIGRWFQSVIGCDSRMIAFSLRFLPAACFSA